MTQAAIDVNIFEYLDYRLFLRDWFDQAKQRYGYSYRVFSRIAGLRSSSYLTLIMNGDRNLTVDTQLKFTKALNLDNVESKYFKYLVLFTQDCPEDERKNYFNKLGQIREYRNMPALEDEYCEFYSEWYHQVIRELILSPEYDGTSEWLVSHITPALTVEQVNHSLKILQKLQLIEPAPGKKGFWQWATPLITTGYQPEAQVVLGYHRKLLTLMKDQLMKVPRKQREVSAMTLGIARSRMPELKEKIQQFRQEVLQMVADDQEPEEVVFLALQLMPASKNGWKELS